MYASPLSPNLDDFLQADVEGHFGRSESPLNFGQLLDAPTAAPGPHLGHGIAPIGVEATLARNPFSLRGEPPP
jgi:hypothetical protein